MTQLPGDLFAIHLRHRNVEHQDVGLQFLDPCQTFFAVGRLADELEFRRTGDDVTDGLTDQRMIVGKNDTNGFHGMGFMDGSWEPEW